MNLHTASLARWGHSIVFALALVGCAGASDDPGSESDDAVVGVTDLTAMENSLALTKDRQDAQGRWSRGDNLLKKGPCYLRTVAAPGGQNWEFRRYTNGAAFFRKKGTAPATGDQRPVTCVDVDVSTGSQKATYALSGIVLDAALRYRLGKGYVPNGASGHSYWSFDNGTFEVADAQRYCDFHFPALHDDPRLDTSDPPVVEGLGATAKCISAGNPMAACFDPGVKACVAAAEKDIGRDTLARPGNNGSYLYMLRVDQAHGTSAAGDTGVYVTAPILSLAYRYAWKKAQKADVYTEPTDPVGTFVGLSTATTNEEITHARYSKLDIHYSVSPGAGGLQFEKLTVTPKNSDAAISDKALVTCSRLVTPGQAAPDFVCDGL